jgi:tRNA-specific 2-thiouridylase
MSRTAPGDIVAVALSGGADSSVAAALLVQEGYQAIGVTLNHWGEGDHQVPNSGAIGRARRTCDVLDIPFHILDARAAFRSAVIDYLVGEYASGRTPNPCVQCNRTVRFGLLLQEVLAMGTTRLATGHYARVRRTDGRWELLRGLDRSKDQSYFLHALDQAKLSRCLFPLGQRTKNEVRALAIELGLPVDKARESQDICFLAGGDYRAFLAREAPSLMQPGPILDQAGRILGRHQGLACYTVGQRKGLGVAAPHPLYVISILPAENALVVGTREQLRAVACRVERMSYVSGEPPGSSFEALAQVRYRSRPAPVTVRQESADEACVCFRDPQSAVTPGQFLVLYDGEKVLGGGAICERLRSVL